MAYMVMAYVVMAYLVMPYTVMSYLVMANIGMAHIVMAYVVMAVVCACSSARLQRCISVQAPDSRYGLNSYGPHSIRYILMAPIVKPYVVMAYLALYSYGLSA